MKDEKKTKKDLLLELSTLREEISKLKTLRKALLETQELHKTLVDRSPIGVYVLQNGAFQYINPQFKASTGFTEDDLLGRDSLSIVHPADRTSVRENAVRMLKGKRTAPYEYRSVTKDGRIRWILGTVISIHFRGKPAVLGNYMDITDQKDAGEKLEDLEALGASILDALPVAVLGLRERRIIFANRAVEAIFGWKPEELIGKNTRVLYRSDEEYEEIGRHFYPVLEKQRTYSEEFPCRHRDGRDIICMVSTSRIGDSLMGKSIVATYEDITERKRAEGILKESESRLRAILEGSPTPTVVIDKNHHVIVWNRSMEKLSGIKAIDVLHTDEQWKIFYEEKRPLMADLLLDEGIETDGEIPLWYAGKYVKSQLLKEAYEATDFSPVQEKWLHFTSAAVRDSSGQIFGAVETMTDISPLKQAEEDLKKSLDKIQKAMIGTVEAMAVIVETRDPYTAGHQHQVAKISKLIAEEMNLPREKVEAIQMAAYIHDIGKIYVPAEILSKPGKLSDVELSIIRTHPQVAYDILKTIEFPWPIADIVYQHHERLDGSGYPRHLKDGEICLESRILGVVDVFESMASHRPYRPTLGLDRAIKELSEHKGILYDPLVVDTLLKLVEEKKIEVA